MMQTTLVIFISAVFFSGESHGYKIDTETTSIKKDTENISQRYRRSSSTYVADENGQRVVIMTSSSPGFNNGLKNFGSNEFDPIGGTGFNKPFGSIGGGTLGGSGGTLGGGGATLGGSSGTLGGGGATLGGSGGTLGGGGATIGGSIGLGNTGFTNNGNRNLGTSKYPSAQLIIEVLRLLGVPNLPLRPPPIFPGGAGGMGGGIGGDAGLNPILLCSLSRCVVDMQPMEPPKQI